MKQLTTGDSDKIRIQPDYTQAVAKQQAEFNKVLGLLRSCEGWRAHKLSRPQTGKGFHNERP